MCKKIIQAGLIALSVILLIMAADTEPGSYALDLSAESVTNTGQGTYDTARDDFYRYVMKLDDDVTVTRSVQEESFFEMVYLRLEELEQEYPDAGILCFVNMATLLDGVVDIEINSGTKTACYLYVGSGNTFYEFQGNMNLPLWHWVLQNEIFPLTVTEDGRHISERSFYFSGDFPKEPGVQTCVYFGDMAVTLYEDERILSTSGVRSGDTAEEFSLRYTDMDDSGNERLHVVTVHTTRLSGYETGAKMWEYFLTRYPDMVYFEAYPAEDRESDAYYYALQESNTEHVYFVYDGQTYEVTDEVVSDGFQYESGYLWGPATRIRRQLDYDYYESCVWKKDTQGLFWADFEDWEFHLEQDIGTGEQFVFETENLPGQDDIEGELWDQSERQMNVYHAGDVEPFQSFAVYSDMRNSFFFEDFNADGYLDLTVNEYYGANGGTASHYLWSPSQECFIKAQDRLDYYGSYSVDEESRRLYIHWHASAVSGTDFLYQWENETECVLLKSMEYTYWEGGEIKIVRGEGADEQVLLDYVLENTDGEIGTGLFWDDLVWEKEITDRSTGRCYHIYYAQEWYAGDEEESGKYESHLYVVNDTLNLSGYLEWEDQSHYTEILWDSADSDETLAIRYEDGMEMVYTALELLQEREPDAGSDGEEN